MRAEHAAALKRLTTRVPPPSNPTRIDWEPAEREIWDGFRFPDDYRALVELYGPGTFGQAISLNVPRASVQSWDVRSQSLLQAEINRERLAAPHIGPPWRYPLYPDRGGLIAWADGADGFPLYWSPQGPPETWPTVIENFEDLSMREYSMPCAEVILALLEETLNIPVFTYVAPERRYVFEPLSTPGRAPQLRDAALRPACTAVQTMRRRLGR